MAELVGSAMHHTVHGSETWIRTQDAVVGVVPRAIASSRSRPISAHVKRRHLHEVDLELTPDVYRWALCGHFARNLTNLSKVRRMGSVCPEVRAAGSITGGGSDPADPRSNERDLLAASRQLSLRTPIDAGLPVMIRDQCSCAVLARRRAHPVSTSQRNRIVPMN